MDGLRSLYDRNKSKVEISPDVSDYFMCKFSVKQGESCFISYVSVLEDNIQKWWNGLFVQVQV